jgi:hypothetical protein
MARDGDSPDAKFEAKGRMGRTTTIAASQNRASTEGIIPTTFDQKTCAERGHLGGAKSGDHGHGKMFNG